MVILQDGSDKYYVTAIFKHIIIQTIEIVN